MPLEDDELYQFSLRMQSRADDIYRDLWPGCHIERLKGAYRGQADPLDQQYGIDVLVTTSQGFSLTIQEKNRRPHHRHWGQFTLEVFNDPVTRAPGEWFNLCADLYFYGYATDDWSDWSTWYLFKVVDLKLAVERGDVRFEEPEQNARHSKANFRPLKWAAFPRVAFVATSLRPRGYPRGR